MSDESLTYRICLRDPIPEIADAARYLDAAVSAYMAGSQKLADDLVRLADISAIRDWTESLWGKNSSYVRYRPPQEATNALPVSREKIRMPNASEKRELHFRDGFHCRFCGIPLIRKEVRQCMQMAFPMTLRWGKTNKECHSAFQAMWLQYDHITPHSKGGTNALSNIVITCAPCNFGRMSYTLEEVGLADPRLREPVRSNWDGLERYKISR